ncbi:hypothetical protein DKT68_08295 [Micromonospora acroterricola]|uniref:Uncharacterized protein n=2 Tax=Micromonospora acroterricola TaxID=2202421 RepID=A0A317DAG7_9ACTN|nr:hypothetical protein DKT68_08295 [Micromonospora acroterricola]
MLAAVAAAVTANGIEVDRFGDVERFTAEELSELSVLARRWPAGGNSTDRPRPATWPYGSLGRAGSPS